MAAFSGKQGQVTFATTAVSSVLSWSIDATCDVADASIMDVSAAGVTKHWKDYIAGFKDWTATVECNLDDGGIDPDLDTDFAQDTDGIALVFFCGITAGGSRKYSGNAIITNIAPSTDLNDVAKVTYSIQGSGTLSVAAA